MADAYAERGYLTVVVDLFNGDPVPLNRPEGFELSQWVAHGSSGDNPHNKEAIDPIIVKAIQAIRDMGVKHIGAVGYCFGAKVRFFLASTLFPSLSPVLFFLSSSGCEAKYSLNHLVRRPPLQERH